MTQTNDGLITTLRAGAPYIHAHRGRTFVIYIPGEAIQSSSFCNLVYDIALLHSLGVRLVLAFGARPQIRTALQKAHIKAPVIGDIRVTTPAAIDLIKQVIGGVNIELNAQLSSSLINTPMSGAHLTTVSGNWITAKPLGIVNGTNYQQTGEVRRIDVSSIRAHLDDNQIVILPCLGYSPSGEVFNLMAEEVANTTAAALAADKLIFLHPGKPLHLRSHRIPAQLNLDATQQLITQAKEQPKNTATLHALDLTRLEAALLACQQGVKRAHLVSFDSDGALLRELYSRDGFGTLITADPYDQIRAAKPDDLAGLLALIKPLEEKGILVPRSREQIELELEHYQVMARDNMIIGCYALIPYPHETAGELACVAVHADYQNAGRATQLLTMAETKARALGLTQLFILTTKAAHWFIEHGFKKAKRAQMPIGKQALYNNRRNSDVYIKLL